MGTVHALSEYRDIGQEELPIQSVLYAPPVIKDSEIFARDFTKLESVVFAVLKIREILRYHVRTNEEWQFHVLGLLDAAYNYSPDKPELLTETAQSLKGYVLEEINTENNRDMTKALLLCDLIQKSPARKRSAPR